MSNEPIGLVDSKLYAQSLERNKELSRSLLLERVKCAGVKISLAISIILNILLIFLLDR